MFLEYPKPLLKYYKYDILIAGLIIHSFRMNNLPYKKTELINYFEKDH